MTDQAGIVAGSGGYAIYVENNTDLKGAVIASTAEDKRLNSLDTGTISFSDIQNKADFDVKHISISAGTGGGLPGVSPGAVYNKSESDSSVTKSAVEGGTLTVRHQDEQTQDVDSLSRDTANANNPLGQLFDKEKELDKIREVELVSEVAQLTTKVMDNADRLEAQRQVNAEGGPNEAYINKAKEALASQNPTQEDIDNLALSLAIDDRFKVISTGGIGGSTTKAINAASNVIKGILTGDIVGGLAGAGAPYLAEKLKPLEESDPVAHKIAHGILGAVVAELQGGSAVSGGIGAATGETVVKYIIDAMYPGKNVGDLNEYEKERVSAVTSLVSGLASTAVGGDVYDAGTAMNASKNAVENNSMAKPVVKGLEKGYEACMKNATCRNGLAQLGVNFGLTNDQTQEAMDIAQTRDIEQIKQLTPEQLAYIDKQIDSKHPIALVMFGDQTWGDKIYHETTIAVDPHDKPKLEGIQIPEPQKPDIIGTPIPEQSKGTDLSTPIIEQDKNSGTLTGTDISNVGDWRDFILTNQNKSFVNYKGDLNKGDQVDLSKFTDRQKVFGGKANYVDPETGWSLSPDRAGTNSHGGSSWKLIDRKGDRVATLDKDGNVLRK